MSEKLTDSAEQVKKLADVIKYQKERLGLALGAKERLGEEIDPGLQEAITEARGLDLETLRENMDLSAAVRLEDGSILGARDGRGVDELSQVRIAYSDALDVLRQ